MFVSEKFTLKYYLFGVEPHKLEEEFWLNNEEKNNKTRVILIILEK